MADVDLRCPFCGERTSEDDASLVVFVLWKTGRQRVEEECLGHDSCWREWNGKSNALVRKGRILTNG